MKIKNRSAHRVSYSIPNGARRIFNAGESMEITVDELTQLIYQPGGRELIDRYLLIPAEGREALDIGEVQPEYDYTEEQIKNIMLKGSLDEFLDMLDFAPEGVITLIQDYSISLPLADMNKMEAFKNKFGYDIQKAIEAQKAVEQEIKKDKVAPAAPQRRVQPSKYKIVE